MKKIIWFLVMVCFALIVKSCNTTDPPDNEQNISLKLEDVSSTEAWITLTTNNLQLPATVTLKQTNSTGDSKSQILNLITQDSLLYVDSLLPNQNYKYQSTTTQQQVPSNELSVTTMDTTSHNFTFETFTFGGTTGSSVLYDCAIISPDNIWCVGAFYMNDSLGQSIRYNAVHWDGIEWKFYRVMFYTFCGQQHQNAYPASSIIAFSEEEIWIAMKGDQIAKIENGIQTQTICLPSSFSINKIWGNSSNNLYVVGNEGNIARYNGSNWVGLNSGTDVDLKDIYGTPDGKSVWAAGYEDFKPTVLLKITNTRIETVFSSRDYLFVFDSNNISGGIGGVWANNNNFVFLTTWYSLYRKAIYTDSSQAQALKSGNPTILFGLKSRGTNTNNIFTIGSKNIIHHYNGTTFKTYHEPPDNSVTYYGLDVKTNISVTCGQKFENGISDKAIITFIKK
jgi:hypothetical protein